MNKVAEWLEREDLQTSEMERRVITNEERDIVGIFMLRGKIDTSIKDAH